MVGNIGRNYIVQLHEEITVFFGSGIKYRVLLCTQCHTHALSFLFVLKTKSLTTSFSFGVKHDDCLGTLVSCEKY